MIRDQAVKVVGGTGWERGTGRVPGSQQLQTDKVRVDRQWGAESWKPGTSKPIFRSWDWETW